MFRCEHLVAAREHFGVARDHGDRRLQLVRHEAQELLPRGRGVLQLRPAFAQPPLKVRRGAARERRVAQVPRDRAIHVLPDEADARHHVERWAVAEPHGHVLDAALSAHALQQLVHLGARVAGEKGRDRQSAQLAPAPPEQFYRGVVRLRDESRGVGDDARFVAFDEQRAIACALVARATPFRRQPPVVFDEHVFGIAQIFDPAL